MVAQSNQANISLTLQVIDDDTDNLADNYRLQIEIRGVEGLVMGRSGNGSPYVPDIDLAPYEAFEKGISRRHAALVQYKGAVHIMDLDSMNGTFVNSNRVPSQMAVAVASGDILTFADLKLRILSISRKRPS